jgi:hypothetical protein
MHKSLIREEQKRENRKRGMKMQDILGDLKTTLEILEKARKEIRDLGDNSSSEKQVFLYAIDPLYKIEAKIKKQIKKIEEFLLTEV